jgi:hypothetical protein
VTSTGKTIRHLFLAIICVSLFVGIGNDARSHVEPNMPDPIAEMEYQIMLDLKPEDFETR